MKINRFFVIVILMAFAHSLVASDNVIINGNVITIPDSTVVYLTRFAGRSGIDIAIDTVINGKFHLFCSVDSGLTKTKLYLSKDNQNSRGRMLYLRPDSKIEIIATDPFVETWNVESNVPEQPEFDSFISGSKKLLDLQQEYNGFTRSMLEAANVKVKPSLDLISNESLRDSLQVATMLRDMDLLQQMHVTPVWLDKMEEIARSIRFYDDYSDTLKEKLQNLYLNLSEADKNSRQAIIANAVLNPPVKFKKGEIISDVEFMDIDGRQHHLSELCGKWVLLDFWTFGCYSSMFAFPELKKFADENSNRVVVVSLSIDDENTWRMASEMFVKIEGNNWNEGKEDMGLFQKFGADGTPTFVLISPKGEINGKWMLYNQGSFERQFKLYSREKGKAEYSEIDSVRYIKNPKYDYNETLGRLDIEGIEISEDGTKVDFFANGAGITISPDTYLLLDDGTKLKLKDSFGVTPGQEVDVDTHGTGNFSLIFEPMPKETQSFTYVEAPGGWLAIKNVQVKKLNMKS